MDSPHPRGWTRIAERYGVSAMGFPAPAGMDPSSRRGRSSSSRIPRTRGDGPRARWPEYSGPSDSPHPRGWTRGVAVLGVRRDGFPAPAGMDPPAAIGRSHRSGIPRTRGDGPRPIRSFTRPRVDSPHPRGWTCIFAARDLRGFGFPAPAGMDPTRGPPARGRRGIPRTRGDGPLRAVPPPGAGTDSPHPRGWTLSGRRAGLLPADSPHPRGWTQAAQDVRTGP